jgi:hypothetical protein
MDLEAAAEIHLVGLDNAAAGIFQRPLPAAGSALETPRSRAMSSSACLTSHDTMPGLAPQHDTAVMPPGLRRRAASTVSRSA